MFLSGSLLLLAFGQTISAVSARQRLLPRQDASNPTTSDSAAATASADPNAPPSPPPIGFVLLGDGMTGALTFGDPGTLPSSVGWSAGFCNSLWSIAIEDCVSFAPEGPTPPPTDDDASGSEEEPTDDETAPTDDGTDAPARARRLVRRQTDSNSTETGGEGTTELPLFTAATALNTSSAYPAALNAIREMKGRGVTPIYAVMSFGNDDHSATTDPINMSDSMKTMLAGVKEAGAEPLIMTTMTRRAFNERDRISDGLRPYAVAALNLAESEKVKIMDFHWASLRFCEDLGSEGCEVYNLTPEDDTYLNTDGVDIFGRLAAELVKDTLPLGVLLLVPNFKARSLVGGYVDMGIVEEKKADAASGLVVAVSSLLAGFVASIMFA